MPKVSFYTVGCKLNQDETELIAQKMIDTNDQMVRIGEEGARAAEQLWAAAEVSRADVLQARIEAEMAKVNRNVAENRHRAAWRRLAGLLGRPDMAPVEAKLRDRLLRWHLAARTDQRRTRAGFEMPGPPRIEGIL